MQIYLVDEGNEAAVSAAQKLASADLKGGQLVFMSKAEIEAMGGLDNRRQGIMPYWLPLPDDEPRAADQSGFDASLSLHLANLELIELLSEIESKTRDSATAKLAARRFDIVRRHVVKPYRTSMEAAQERHHIKIPDTAIEGGDG